MKNKKGITLIALILTIIILIILAGVSISALVGDNGIVSQAMKAKEESDKNSAKELVELAWAARLSKYYEDYEKGEASLIENYFTVDKLNEVLGDGGSIVSVNKNDATKTYDVVFKNKDGNDYTINMPLLNNKSVALKKELYGMKVATGASNIYSEENYNDELGEFYDNWKIFYIDTTNVYLIYGTVKFSWLPDLNVTLNNRGTGEKKFSTRTEMSDDYFINPSHWQNIKDLLTSESSIFYGKNVTATGAPTLEMWINSWNEKNSDNLDYEEILELGITSEEMSSKQGYDFGEDALYYANEQIAISSYYAKYFLATPGEEERTFFVVDKEGGIYPLNQGVVRPILTIPIADFQAVTGIIWQ